MDDIGCGGRTRAAHHQSRCPISKSCVSHFHWRLYKLECCSVHSHSLLSPTPPTHPPWKGILSALLMMDLAMWCAWPLRVYLPTLWLWAPRTFFSSQYGNGNGTSKGLICASAVGLALLCFRHYHEKNMSSWPAGPRIGDTQRRTSAANQQTPGLKQSFPSRSVDRIINVYGWRWLSFEVSSTTRANWHRGRSSKGGGGHFHQGTQGTVSLNLKLDSCHSLWEPHTGWPESNYMGQAVSPIIMMS